jgi:epoxide hydrolase-like predicted phosphatase
MTIRGVYFDFGGVLVRTEDQAPRTRLAKSLGLSAREIEQIVFEGDSSVQATLGAITEEQHWQAVAARLGLPESELPRLAEEFFRGDSWDQGLFDFLHALRGTHKVGLISNAWTGLRKVIVKHGFSESFDTMIISAEVGLAKPDARIYRLALEKLGVAAEEAVFVDDVVANVDGARAVGMHAIQFTRPQTVLDELKALLTNHR